MSDESAVTLAGPGAGGGQSPSLVRYETASNRGVFFGVGGSFNSVKIEQDIAAAGISQVTTGGVPVAQGAAGGPAAPISATQTTFAPSLQIGHYRTSSTGQWLWGTKFNYKYLGVSSNKSPIDDPQNGAFTSLGGVPDTFTGNVVLGSSLTEVNHQLSLIPYLGHSFRSGYIYFGAGPTVFNVQSNLYDVIGYADINGSHFSITGTPSNYTNKQWMWGGLMQLGTKYRLSDAWFIDVNYDFAVTGRNTSTWSSPFTSSSISGGTTYTTTGTLYVGQTQRITAQALTVTLNLSF